jgi:hypothetical protein
MKFTMMIVLLPIFSGMGLWERLPGKGQDFDRQAFYSVMASGDLNRLNAELLSVESAVIPEKEAYEGALLMRKAGLVARPAEKLKIFKTGRLKLESALLKDSTNGEYHFLRLTIQEHAPGIVKYSRDLEKDRHYIHANFKRLSPAVRQAIIEYSKHSKTLNPEDFGPKNL